jgi:hypothetical protein
MRKAGPFAVKYAARLLGWALALIAAGACSRTRGAAVKPNVSAPEDGAPCVSSGCVEVVYERAPTGAPQRGIQVDGTDLYWSEVVSDAQGRAVSATIFAGPKRGGGPVRALGAWGEYQNGNSLVVDESHAYWLASRKLMRVPKEGGAPVSLAIPQGDTLDLGPIHDLGDAVLVGTHACRFLARVPKDGSAPQLWPLSQRTTTGGNTGLESDGTVYYCASGNQVHRLDSRTGETRELASYAGKAGPLRKVGADLYWGDSSNPDRKGPALVLLAGGVGEPAAVAAAYGETGRLLLDSPRGKIYWMTGLDYRGCDVVAYDLQSRDTTFLARDQDRSGDTAQDADYLYWAASHALMRIHK